MGILARKFSRLVRLNSEKDSVPTFPVLRKSHEALRRYRQDFGPAAAGGVNGPLPATAGCCSCGRAGPPTGWGRGAVRGGPGAAGRSPAGLGGGRRRLAAFQPGYPDALLAGSASVATVGRRP